MREYTTTDGKRIKKNGRVKGVKWTTAGEPYFVWGSRRYKLGEVLRLSYPILYHDENDKLCDIGGYIGITNCFGVLVEIIADGEAVQLWNELD